MLKSSPTAALTTTGAGNSVPSSTYHHVIGITQRTLSQPGAADSKVMTVLDVSEFALRYLESGKTALRLFNFHAAKAAIEVAISSLKKAASSIAIGNGAALTEATSLLAEIDSRHERSLQPHTYRKKLIAARQLNIKFFNPAVTAADTIHSLIKSLHTIEGYYFRGNYGHAIGICSGIIDSLTGVKSKQHASGGRTLQPKDMGPYLTEFNMLLADLNIAQALSFSTPGEIVFKHFGFAQFHYEKVFFKSFNPLTPRDFLLPYQRAHIIEQARLLTTAGYIGFAHFLDLNAPRIKPGLQTNRSTSAVVSAASAPPPQPNAAAILVVSHPSDIKVDAFTRAQRHLRVAEIAMAKLDYGYAYEQSSSALNCFNDKAVSASQANAGNAQAAAWITDITAQMPFRTKFIAASESAIWLAFPNTKGYAEAAESFLQAKTALRNFNLGIALECAWRTHERLASGNGKQYNLPIIGNHLMQTNILMADIYFASFCWCKDADQSKDFYQKAYAFYMGQLDNPLLSSFPQLQSHVKHHLSQLNNLYNARFPSTAASLTHPQLPTQNTSTGNPPPAAEGTGLSTATASAAAMTLHSTPPRIVWVLPMTALKQAPQSGADDKTLPGAVAMLAGSNAQPAAASASLASNMRVFPVARRTTTPMLHFNFQPTPPIPTSEAQTDTSASGQTAAKMGLSAAPGAAAQ